MFNKTKAMQFSVHLNTCKVPQVSAAENQLSFQQESGKYLQKCFNGHVCKKFCKADLYINYEQLDDLSLLQLNP